MAKRGKKSQITKLLYALLIGFGVISFWRGLWTLMDLYLFPNSLVISSWVSLFIGLAILYFTKHVIAELT